MSADLDEMPSDLELVLLLGEMSEQLGCKGGLNVAVIPIDDEYEIRVHGESVNALSAMVSKEKFVFGADSILPVVKEIWARHQLHASSTPVKAF